MQIEDGITCHAVKLGYRFWNAEVRKGSHVLAVCPHGHGLEWHALECALEMRTHSEWQDESRTFTPAEQQLSVRIDGQSMPGGAGLGVTP